MKKLLLTGLIVAFVLSFASVSFAEEIDRVVGDDIEVEEGEFKIVSVDEEADVVGDDIEIGEDEAKIVSVDEEADVVGDDIEIGEDEAKIVSVGEDEEENNKWPVAAGVSAAVLVAAGIIVLIKKVLWP